MRFRLRSWVFAVALTTGFAFAVIAWRTTAASGALSISILSVIPGGVDDARGTEMQLLTLLIRNTNRPTGGPNHSMYETVLEQRNAVIEAKLHDGWHPVEGKLDCTVQSRHAAQRLVMVPADTEAVRVSVKYSSRAPSIRWHLLWSVARVEGFLGVRLAPTAFYKWAYQKTTRRSSLWTAQHIEVPLPSKAVAGEGSQMRQVL